MGLTDAELLSRHVAGDGSAFAELARRHQHRLWAVAVRTLGDRDEAADAVQDALVKAFRKAGDFRGDAAVTTWLHRIVVNTCLDRLRSRSAHLTESLPETDHGISLADPADSLARREGELDVRAALATLPEEQRAALVLVDMLGYSVEEAARMLECAVGTVKSRCARGRARLVPVLAGYGSGRRAPGKGARAGAGSPFDQATKDGNRGRGPRVEPKTPRTSAAPTQREAPASSAGQATNAATSGTDIAGGDRPGEDSPGGDSPGGDSPSGHGPPQPGSTQGPAP